MAKTVSLEDAKLNYAMSAPFASFKYERVMQGKVKNPRDKALKLALNQIRESGAPQRETIKALEAISARYNHIVLILKSQISSSQKVGSSHPGGLK